MIAGSARGHRLRTVDGESTRPTTDRVKESLFNILAPFIEGIDVLDLFSGTGSLAIEALSRGAAGAVLVDGSAACIRVIGQNLESVGFTGRAEVIRSDAMSALAVLGRQNRKFDVFLLDPPYGKRLVPASIRAIAMNGIWKPDCIIAAERHYKDEAPAHIDGFGLVSDRRYGDTALSFYRPESLQQKGRLP